MNNAIQENESQAAEASGVSNELKPGITIDLSRKKIYELPDEVVDIFKHELERLVFDSHSSLLECSRADMLSFSGTVLPFPITGYHLSRPDFPNARRCATSTLGTT